jgi:hypothetical protein
MLHSEVKGDVLVTFSSRSRLWAIVLFLTGLCLPGLLPLFAQSAQPLSPSDAAGVYAQLKASSLTPNGAAVENVVLTRDRVTITFSSGTLYFGPIIEGKVRLIVFSGSGKFHAEPPPVEFEQQNVRRLLHEGDVTSDFKTAILRFTDDTADFLPKPASTSPPTPAEAARLASEFEARLLEETGLSVSARETESIANKETPGFFLAQFAGGKRGRFTFLLDAQTRVPTANFAINAGETGLIFAYNSNIYSNDVWMAFRGQEDYAKGTVHYSDEFNLVDTPLNALSLDLREPKKVLGLTARLDLVSNVEGLRVLPMSIGESLDTFEQERQKKQMHVLAARLGNGTAITFLQEPWEAGFTLLLPEPVARGKAFTVEIDLRGDFMIESTGGTYFPRSTTDWYPRHGYLARSKFNIRILHRKRDRVVSVGTFVKDEPSGEFKDYLVAEFLMDQPISLVSFAAGPYEIHKDTAKQESGTVLPIEFYSMPGAVAAIKEDFILAEMNNSIRFLSSLFGEYPYPVFRGAFHPFAFGQGFPTTIMIPGADSAGRRTYSFIAHETSHQWWGDMVLWRSYRDQWLSEGFADYSGLLYTQRRDKTSSEKDFVKEFRDHLKLPPRTLTGVGSGRLVDVGPLVMGHRLQTRETAGAYTVLVYEKGALVLRMIHFLFSDPRTGNAEAFYAMMKDFVNRYKNKTASTEDFFAVANEHVKDTFLSQKYHYQDLNWFFRQWVTQTYFPSYELTYHIEDDPAGGGAVILKGEITQSGLPESEQWFMPLPLVMQMPGGKSAIGSIAVQGSRTPVSIRLQQRPEKVELDPGLWVLSEKTTTTRR